MAMVSVIIPVYKVEDFLPACLDSMLAQTWEDWEAVCVDDGSPDNCGAILDQYAAADSRFRVLHTENGGLPVARNRALDIAQGKYIFCLDSDDSLAPDTLKTMVSIAEEDDVDMVICSYTYVFPNGEKTERPAVYSPGQTGRRIKPNYQFYHTCPALPGGKLYRHDLIKKHRLRYCAAAKNGEDLLFNFFYFAHMKSYSTADSGTYYYLQRAGSITSDVFNQNAPIEYYMSPDSFVLSVLPYFIQYADAPQLGDLCAGCCLRLKKRHDIQKRAIPKGGKDSSAVLRLYLLTEWAFFRYAKKWPVIRYYIAHAIHHQTRCILRPAKHALYDIMGWKY